MITDIKPDARLPFKMMDYIRRCGIPCVHPVVDILNYVMLECGQPLHAYDQEKLASDKIIVRMANDEERFVTLGGREVVLDKDTLVIGDGRSAQSIAGVIGGEKSCIDTSTTSAVLECAYFAPQTVRGVARHYGLQTEASHRYERGVDFLLQTRRLGVCHLPIRRILPYSGWAHMRNHVTSSLSKARQSCAAPQNVTQIFGQRYSTAGS